MIIKSIDSVAFKKALLKRGITQWKMAAELGLSPSMLSHYVTGRHVCPTGLRLKMEQYMQLEEGSLKYCG